MGTEVLHTRAVCLRAQTPAPGSEPLGGRQNLEAPATTWSPVGGGASRPQHFGLHHLLSVRGEIKEGPSAPSASPSSSPATKTMHLPLYQPHRPRPHLVPPHGSTWLHTSGFPASTTRGSPQFDALQGKPGQSTPRSHFRQGSGPITARLSQGRVTRRRACPSAVKKVVWRGRGDGK